MKRAILGVGFVGLALATPLALVSASSTRAFVDFDERIVSVQAGVIIVRAPIDVHGPIETPPPAAPSPTTDAALLDAPVDDAPTDVLDPLPQPEEP